MSAPISLVIGSRNLTPAYSELTFSNVDPGGFEQLQVTTTDARDIDVGDEVMARCGLSTAWHGRVNEIGPKEGGGRSAVQIAAVGYSALLTDKRMQMVYVDRDLSQWGPSRTSRRIALLAAVGATLNIFEPGVQQDDNGDPAVRTQVQGPWGYANCEARYAMPSGLTVASLYYDFVARNHTPTGATWGVNIEASDNEDMSAASSSGDIGAASGAATYTPAAQRRYIHLRHDYTLAFAGTDTYWIDWRRLAVYANHGLTKRGTDPGGFYPGDIAGHAHAQSGAGFDTVIDDSSGLIVRHSVYRDPVSHEQVIADMAKLMGWHWGVWEPATFIADADLSLARGVPQMFFTAPPTTATAVVSRDQITGLDAPRVRADRLYDTAKVAWRDSAGSGGVQTVTITNPLAVSARVTGRTLDLDMGLGDATSATAFGTFALNLALAAARGGGSGQVPDQVVAPDGTRRPACLLRSGRDRIRISDLPDAGPWPETDPNRQDTFLVRRVETTVSNGLLSTRIEFDGGADLLEVLGARLALAQASMGG